MNINIKSLIRPNILALSPYSSARDEYTGKEAVFLDANENPFNRPYNRYPDPLQKEVKSLIAKLKGIAEESIFLGNGSDEAIDNLFRIFCRPGKDNVISIDPSYGMYQVCAEINDIEVRKVSLTNDFQPDVNALLAAADGHSKIMFLCSPNNPTANSLDAELLNELIEKFKGIVVIDEAYIDFSSQASFISNIKENNNLVVLQTFSKAWGLAGIRLGMCFASPEIIGFINKVKYPYNVNVITQKIALDFLQNKEKVDNWISTILSERSVMSEKLKRYPFVSIIYPSDANFLLVKVDEAKNLYDYLVDNKVITRDRSKVKLCDKTLRITVGSVEENQLLYTALDAYLDKK